MSDEYEGTGNPEAEKEEHIEYGTERPGPHWVTNSEDRSEKPQR